ncbi:MAG: hypothetical protein ACRDP1_03815 [Nocardioidaceae bacterium]
MSLADQLTPGVESRELAECTGLVDAVTPALADSYRGPWVHAPGRVFTDLAVAVADGADATTGIAVLGDRKDLHGPVASMPTTWRVLDEADAVHLPALRTAHALARERAWAWWGVHPSPFGPGRRLFHVTGSRRSR